MEPLRGFWASILSFICFLPFFVGLLLLGIIKGAIFCPLICLIMATGNSAVILGLWPAHAIWTYYCISRSKRLGPVLKIVLCIGVTVLLILWPPVGIVGSIIGGAGYGFFAPLMVTFKAIEEGKTDKFIHCITDGTWSTMKGCFTVVRDLTDVCFHSYFAVMDDIRLHKRPNGERYEISNDILDLPEGSYFPRLPYRKKAPLRSGSLSRHSSFPKEKQDSNAPSRSVSFKNSVLELNPVKLLEHLFVECERYGHDLVAEGVITHNDVEDAKSGKGDSRIVSIGLPAYSILKALLRSAMADTVGILLSDNTEITSTNRPKDTFFDWFFDPLLIMKEQIRTENLSEDEEDYLCKLVLLAGDPIRVKDLNARLPSHSERRRAELDAIARRLQGITKSISRYPTFKRRFDGLVKSLSEKLEKKINGSQSVNGLSTQRSKNGFAQLCSLKSIGSKASAQAADEDSNKNSPDVSSGQLQSA